MIAHRRVRNQRRLSRSRRLGRAACASVALLSVCLPLLASNFSRPVVVVPIKGEITDIVRDSVKRRVSEALGANAQAIVFEINTLGGSVTSALDICRTIKSIPDDVTTIAWVQEQAYSAGAMISVSCGEIVMSKSSSIGDCAPIMVSPTGDGVAAMPATERAKAESPVLQEFRDSASRNGYDPLLSRAMVTVGEEVWWIENAGGTRRFVTTDEKKKLIDDAGEHPSWHLVDKIPNPGAAADLKIDQPIDSKDTLLTMSQAEAVGFGFAKAIVSTDEQLIAHLGLAGQVVRMDTSGWENFAVWLNSALIRGILLAIVMIGGYIEFQHPGLILPGITALIALAIFLAAPYAAGLADIWTFALLGIGVVLLLVELFLIPGFGFVGLIGGTLIFVGLLTTFVPRDPTAPMSFDLSNAWPHVRTGILVIFGAMMVSIAGIGLLLRYLPNLPVARGLMIHTPDASVLSIPDILAGIVEIGDIGIVETPLRPGGRARFGHEVVEVQSQGDYIERGSRVRIIKRDGPVLFVRSLQDTGGGMA
ncbi:MAG: ATP-dependent Clp protease proteolytic subunit [Phycisphaerales bacterium]|nr:ATP-dependent Clp protease proteolytic subunit [Phycisphaerales bacterium]